MLSLASDQQGESLNKETMFAQVERITVTSFIVQTVHTP